MYSAADGLYPIPRFGRCVIVSSGTRDFPRTSRLFASVLTDLYDQNKDIKLAQAAAGHTTSAMTLANYVKGRETISKAAAVVDRAYSA